MLKLVNRSSTLSCSFLDMAFYSSSSHEPQFPSFFFIFPLLCSKDGLFLPVSLVYKHSKQFQSSESYVFIFGVPAYEGTGEVFMDGFYLWVSFVLACCSRGFRIKDLSM